jgi:fluoride exporter
VLVLAVWTGGMIGAWARYRCTHWIYERTGTAFPWGTLAVNVSGSFLVGLAVPALTLSGLNLSAGHEVWRAFVTVGVLSSFTTFSTFALEAVTLVQDGRRDRALAYAACSVGAGLAAVAFGFWLGRTLFV